MNYQQFVQAYREMGGNGIDEWMSDCKKARSFSVGIELAATARTARSRKYPHQRRLPPALLASFAMALNRHERELRACDTFDALLVLIGRIKAGDGIHGIGRLAMYDTAVRIGHRKRDELSAAWRGITPHEVEDILCIFKMEFAGEPGGELHLRAC